MSVSRPTSTFIAMILERFTKIVMALFGGFFVATGAAKIFVFGSFAGTISGIIPASQSVSSMIAVFIIATEIVGGIFLAIRFRLRLVTTIICIMLFIYISILYSSIAHGREIDCNCFGILSVSLPNSLELALDFLLLDLTAFIGFVMIPLTEEHREPRFKLPMFIAILVLTIVQFGMLGSAYRHSQSSASSSAELRDIFAFLKYKEGLSFGLSKGNCLAILVDFYDFNCSTCFDDFSALSDSVRVHYDTLHGKVAAVFKSNATMASWNSRKLGLWSQSNGLVHPAMIVPEGMFRRAKIRRSSVLVFSPAGGVLYRGEIPIGSESRREVLKLILQN